MTNFDDLLFDLRNESLLDEYFAHPFENIKNFSSANKSVLVVANPQNQIQVNFQRPIKVLVLPNFNFFKNNSDNFDIKKVKKRFPIKIYTKSILCQNCKVEVPFFIRNCRNCCEKKVTKYFNVSMFILIILLIVFLILVFFTI